MRMAMMRSSYMLTLSNLLLLLAAPISCGAKVPAVIVFGDSSVDTGNNNRIKTIAKSNFPPYGRDLPGGRPTGRFSNGRLVGDFISEAFGLKKLVPAYLDPNYNISEFATGVCFASAGTGYDNATSDILSVIPLWKEVEYYKEYQHRLKHYVGAEKANEIITEAVYIASIGTNDFLENYFSQLRRRSQFTVEGYQNFLLGKAEDFVRQLYGLGVRKLSIGGLPPMGCLPLERTVNVFYELCNEEYNVVAVSFNAKLSNLVGELNHHLPGLKLVLSNPYDILQQIVQNPFDYGFEVTNRGCCGTGEFEMGYLCNNRTFTCPDADKFVFWDSFHPTEKTNKIISDYIVKNNLNVFL
ncbi:hypothetical protein Nepgr_000562 [Nepenthes gracilis]|uniref:GDSL esterase/lipase n=1 Tax=Nepenthes gracilis TaxID=150966 RepID=A0AAD3P3N7_NEPGR|nr:hypothetical protein Nepgr_000562 [Nepenthes gracilis]